MANGDNPLPQMQLDPNQFPTGASAPQPQPAPTPQPPAPSTATPPDPTSNTASSLAPTPIGAAPSPGVIAMPQPYQFGGAGRGGAVKNVLTRAFYGMGQAMLAHVGLPTDYDIQKTTYQQAIQANEQQLKQAQFAWQQSQVPVMTPYGPMNMPLAVAQKMGPAWAQTMGRVWSQQQATRYQKIPGIGIFDTWDTDEAGQPTLVAKGGATITYTPDIVNRYGLDPQLIGQTVPETQFTSAMNAGARWAPQQRTGVQNLATATGVVQVPTYSRTQRVAQPVVPTTPGPAQGGGGVPAAAIQQMPAGSPGRQAVTGAGPTARQVQMPGGGPVMPLAAWNEYDSKYLQPANAIEKSWQMSDAAYQQYQAAKARGQDLPTGAPAMVALSNHLATTFGGVKGARVTEGLIQAHLGARSISDAALVAVQKLTNGDPLSPAQWDAFHELIGQSRNIQWQLAAKYGNARGFDLRQYLPSDLQKLNKGPGGAAPAQPSTAPNFFQKFGGASR